MAHRDAGKLSDRQYLQETQYRDPYNLEARIALHEQCSLNPLSFHRWLFDFLATTPYSYSQVLEIGCGPATLWTSNLDRIPAGWLVTLTDLSTGMLQKARQNLASVEHSFYYALADAQALSFRDASFDAVLANHMMYHVPDKALAFSEIKRVLRPGGRFYAATNGSTHMQELAEIAHKFSPNAPLLGTSFSNSFTLENGQAQLQHFLSEVNIHRYPDALVITSAQPLVAYVRATSAGSSLDEEGLTRYIEQRIREQGAIRITKSTGLFTAIRG